MKPKVFLPLLFALTASGFAQAKEAAKTIDPKAKAVLEEGLKAVGTPEAIAKIKSRTSVGSVSMPAQGMTLSLEIKQKAPMRFYSKAVIPEVMTVEQGYDGKEGWSKDSIQGSRKLTGPELAQAREGAALFFEKQTLENLASAKLLPDSKDGDKSYTVVETTNKDGDSKTLYFDKETKLLSRVAAKAAVGPGGEMLMDTRATDYKEVDGVQIAFTVTTKVGPQNMIMKFSSVEHNKEIDDSLFQMKK